MVGGGAKIAKRRAAAVFALLVVSIVIVYGQTLSHDFISMDDPAYVTRNEVVRDGLSTEGVVWAFADFRLANYQPVTWLSHMLDVEIFGLDAGGHHAVNVAFHLANACLLLLLLLWMTRELWCAAMVAALFALHPAHVESVAWVASRKDLVSTFFMLLAIGAYVKYVAARSPVAYATLLVCWLLGLLAKPMVVTLPFLLLLLDYWPLGRTTRCESGWLRANRHLVVEKIPLFVLALAAALLTVLAQGVAIDREVLTLIERSANAVSSYHAYLAKAPVPAGLAAFYPYPVSWSLAAVLGDLAVLTAITLAVCFLAQRAPYLAVGWFWFAGTLVPVIGIVQIGSQAMADRYTYVPYIGLSVAAVYGAAAIVRYYGIGGRLVTVACGLLLAGYGFAAWQYTGHWRDSVSLYTHSLLVTDPSYAAFVEAAEGDQALPSARFYYLYFGLANALREKGEHAAALAHYDRLLAIRPGYPGGLANKGLLLAEMGLHEEAVATIETLDAGAGGRRENLAYVYASWGVALARAGRLGAATANLRRSSELRPQASTFSLLGTTYAALGENEKAREALQRALDLQPDHPEAKAGLDALEVGISR